MGLTELFGGKDSGIVNAVMQMIGNNEQGGLNGILDSFKSKGKADKAESWISKGENKPVTEEELREGLGEERIEAIAAKSGTDKETVISKLTSILPGVIDKLTPDGNVPQGNLMQQGLNFLKNQIK